MLLIDVGTKYFIIFSGSVSVLIRTSSQIGSNKKKEVENNSDTKDNKKNKDN